jgi:hypothetical protein
MPLSLTLAWNHFGRHDIHEVFINLLQIGQKIDRASRRIEKTMRRCFDLKRGGTTKGKRKRAYNPHF